MKKSLFVNYITIFFVLLNIIAVKAMNPTSDMGFEDVDSAEFEPVDDQVMISPMEKLQQTIAHIIYAIEMKEHPEVIIFLLEDAKRRLSGEQFKSMLEYKDSCGFGLFETTIDYAESSQPLIKLFEEAKKVFSEDEIKDILMGENSSLLVYIRNTGQENSDTINKIKVIIEEAQQVMNEEELQNFIDGLEPKDFEDQAIREYLESFLT